MSDSDVGKNEAVAPEAEVMASADDVEKNKVLAIVGYIFPILFFVPLINDAKNSVFAKFHANQHLLLLIGGFGVSILGAVIPIIGWFIILPFGYLGLFVMAVLGLINAARGEMKPMPLIGGIVIIK